MGQVEAGQAGSVLVLAPYARDTALTCEFLVRSGIAARSCADIEELCRRLGDGAGAVLIMEEALADEALARLRATLARQPRWSDIAVLVVVDARHKPEDPSTRRFDALGNVTLLTRPAHPVTLLSAVRSALRARERQYRLRDALGPFEESHSRLVEALPLAILVYLDGRVIYANPTAAALLGAESARALIDSPLARWLHPDAPDTERLIAGLSGGSDTLAGVQHWRRADGSDIALEVECAPMVWGRRPAVRIAARAHASSGMPEPGRAGIEQLPLMLFAQDRELRYLWVHRFCTGEEPARVVGRRDSELLPHADEAQALEAFKRAALESGETARRTFRLTLPEGERHHPVEEREQRRDEGSLRDLVVGPAGFPQHLDVRVVPVRDASGGATGLVGAAIEIDEHVAREAELRARSERLEQADQRKNEFLAQLAHELRNPLAPIHNAVHVLRIQGDPPDAAHVRWAVDVVGRQVQQLTRLVDDLLDVARIVHGQMKLRREPLELGRVLAQAVETARPQTSARKQTLTYSPPSEPLHVRADAGRVMQALVNLLNNAARYTPAGGDIALSATAEDGWAVISVKDNGIGLTAEERTRIFEPFQQARRPPDAAPAGLGIGLALVKRLIELHDGTVEARSEGPGRGSEFRVRLPLAPQAAAPVPGESASETEATWRVLVVDDDPDVAQSFALLLGLMGYQVRVAHDGGTGLKVAAAFRPHVVFIDIGLPDMDGYALARALRRGGAGSPMRLVALTGYTQDEVRERAVVAGFDAHLLKPVETETIERLLQSFRTAD
jgi:PAS domain S-box-containing protein